MAFFRGPVPEVSVWRRFRNASDTFAVMRRDQHCNAKLRELGMYTFVRWNYVFIAPPLSITKKQIDEGLAIISEALEIADAAL